MAITYPLAFPTIRGVMQITWRMSRAGVKTVSPYSFVSTSIKYPGQRFLADVVLPPLARPEAAAFLAFLLRLDGVSGTFLLTPPEGAVPRGSASLVPGTPVVMGAAQTGNELDVDGLPASETGYLLEGDYIQLGSASTTRLHMVTADVDANASGEATIEIWPDLRESPTDDAAVVVSGAQGRFSVESGEVSADIDSTTLYGMAFGIVEAL